MKFYRLYIFIILLITMTVAYESSDHRGDPNYQRKTEIDGNLIRASIFNYAFAGRTGGNEPTHIPFEWPKNTRQEYMAIVAAFVGAEVVLENGSTQKIVITPHYREDPNSISPSWNFEPVPEFLNENSKSIAKSTDAGSWPLIWPDRLTDAIDPGWVGSWNGYFGKNQYSADQELYYECSDNLYNRYNYFPDSTDLSRRGLGLLMKVRAMAWSQILVNDVVFFLHEVTNDGTKVLGKTVFSIWLADMVGGDDDTNDDRPSFDLLTDVAWCMDAPPYVGNKYFGNTPVGVVATSFLETPGNGVDGIDNDGDADLHPELLSKWDDYETLVPLFTDGEFTSTSLSTGIKLVLIDDNYSRHVIAYPGGDTTVVSQGISYNLSDGLSLSENPDNLIDDDLDGLIDENIGLHLDRLTIDGVIPVRFINYKAFNVGDIVKRGLLVAGDTVTYRQATIAPMIDEVRYDGVDNDGDWDILSDDNGLDGQAYSGDAGEGDSRPTSGFGTGLTGEPNIDLTDVSESDQIGLTSAAYIASSENTTGYSDSKMWREFLVPGKFFDPTIVLEGDYNLHISSGYFPLDIGQTERISISVNLGVDQNDALRNRDVAQKTYDMDYQFAKAPRPPEVTAVADDGKITLYWDDLAEQSFDTYMADLGANGYDFQGYRIYRSTDPAFIDQYLITDTDGVPTYYKPIAQFDLKDGLCGVDSSLDINGIKFNLGSDNGLQHTFVDEYVQNGQRYFYAVTSYDAGGYSLGIAPTECPILIQTLSDGTINTGMNVVEVTPQSKPAGYMAPEIDVEHVSGSSSSKLTIDVIDPLAILDRNTYQITFEDTVYKASKSNYEDTLSTKNYTLVNITDPIMQDTLVDHSNKVQTAAEHIVIQGFQISFKLESVIEMNNELTKWNNGDTTIFSPVFTRWEDVNKVGYRKPSDYLVTFGEVGTGRCIEMKVFFGTIKLIEQDVNFTVRNISEDKNLVFGFWELDNTGGPGKFTSNLDESDIIILMEEDIDNDGDTVLVPTWQLRLKHLMEDTLKRYPQSGDELEIIVKKPFLSSDVYEFTTYGPEINESTLKKEMKEIKVVPNPYVAANSWEPKNPYDSGRGPRVIHFNKVPKDCEITIFNIAGELVDQFEVHNLIDDGIAEWDLLSKDNLAISYGLYLFHVKDLLSKSVQTGKFAVIK
ncbi:hypothetical protein KJ688_01760 [bacterium]|nr:hypothetical protein [bacterium]